MSYAELRALRDRVKAADPDRLVTASGDPVDREDLSRYLVEAGLDFISPHLARDAGTEQRTADATRKYLGWMKELGRAAPIHYQEPFRRDYLDYRGFWQPEVETFCTDLRNAKLGGAASCRRHPGALAGQRRALVFAGGNLADVRTLWHSTRLSDLLHRILAGFRPAADGVRRAPGRQVESRAAGRRDRTILSRRLRASGSAGHHLLRHDRRRNRKPDPRPARRELPAQARLDPPQATDQGGVDHTPIGDHGRRGRLSFPPSSLATRRHSVSAPAKSPR